MQDSGRDESCVRLTRCKYGDVMKLENMDNIKVYKCKDNRIRVYSKDTHKVTSYPRYVVEQILNIKLSPTDDIHHIDGNVGNNSIENLKIIHHGEHQKIHSQKYYDKEMICPICNKTFMWSAKQQCMFYANQKRNRHKNILGKPVCSKRCSGVYGKQFD